MKIVDNWEKEYSHLKGKKLLILGGGPMIREVVYRAQKMGIYTLVLNYNETDAAKEVCDKPILADACNTEEIVDVCIKEKVDGITTGYVDILLPYWHDACERLNFPCYANNQLIKMTTDKNYYKEICSQYGIPVPKTYTITADNCDVVDLDFPVFIKPADASGSRGAFICTNKEEFVKNFKKSLEFSKSKTIITEEYLTGQDIILDYLVKDGVAYCTSIFDRKVYEGKKPPINSANVMIAPSIATECFLNSIHKKINAMARDLGIENGMLFFQGYYKNGKITLFEMGCRLGASYFSVEEAKIGINPIDALIHYALTGKMADYSNYELISPSYKGFGCVLYLVMKPGAKDIFEYKNIDKIRKLYGVEHVIQHYNYGDYIPSGKETDVRLLTVYISVNTMEEVKKCIMNIYELVDVVDSDGNSIIDTLYMFEDLGGLL